MLRCKTPDACGCAHMRKKMKYPKERRTTLPASKSMWMRRCAGATAPSPAPSPPAQRCPSCERLRRPANLRRKRRFRRSSSNVCLRLRAVQHGSVKAPEQPRGTVVLDVAGGVLVPDFHGKSLRTALEEAESAGLELEVNGSGVGQDQSPAAGSEFRLADTCQCGSADSSPQIFADSADQTS